MFHVSAAATNSFFDLDTPNRSHDPYGGTKNPNFSNEFMDPENFAFERAAAIKKIHAMRPANSPAVGITLETNALRVTCKAAWGAARQ